MTPSDYIIVQTILMIILVSATIFYAYQAKKASDSATTSAEASVEMAEEMRNARSPYITIRWGGADTNNRKITAHLENEGFGPALNPECYLTHKGFNFKHKLSWCTTFKVGEKYPFSLPSENFDFKAWKGLAINCDYGGGFGGKFRSILKCESEKNRSLEIIKLNSGDRND